MSGLTPTGKRSGRGFKAVKPAVEKCESCRALRINSLPLQDFVNYDFTALIRANDFVDGSVAA